MNFIAGALGMWCRGLGNMIEKVLGMWLRELSGPG